MADINKQILKAVYASVEMALLELKDISLETRESLVKEIIDKYVASFVPKNMLSEIDYEFILSTIVTRTCSWIEKVQVISDPKNHIAWFTPDKKEDWVYWNSYQETLEDKLSDSSIEALDDSTDKVIEQLEDPHREGSWDRRGLVVGHVQSGKTSHYTGLISKAADAGYKIIVVLAGLHNNLRAQTQLRLEEGFLGFETSIDGNTENIIGVGANRDRSLNPNSGTSRDEKGDFNKSAIKSIGGISPESKPWIFVVKKHKNVLQHLLNWIDKRVADSEESISERKVVTKLPLLIIDDEADNASVDTNEQYVDENGQFDDNHNPTTINKLIRQVLHSFTRKAYVGYTATPFANIFIHNKNETVKEGKDLFPSSFIVNLSTPSQYVGPNSVFSEDGQKLFIRNVYDNIDNLNDEKIGWMPNKHKSSHIPLYQSQEKLPPSLIEALNSFVLATSVRSLRGDGNEHSSMLVHVTRFTNVQTYVSEQIKSYMNVITNKILRKIGDEEIYSVLQKIWEHDFVRVNNSLLPIDNEKIRSANIEKYYITALPSWQEVKATIPRTLEQLKILTINGQAKEALLYEEYKNIGLKVIAIGGDKLSRGLTLEGLSTSYFLRSSKMYDTLMQMGRWFGYRPRYYDLCRLYTSEDLVDWYSKISDASEELREEFDIMVANEQKPHEFGLKVQSHPGLLVTSPIKMRTGKTLHLSFSGDISETVAFDASSEVITKNKKAVERLLINIKTKEVEEPFYEAIPGRSLVNGRVFEKVDCANVIEFLSQYTTHKDSYKSNSDLIANFIRRMNLKDELTSWTVAFMGGEKTNQIIDGYELNATRRAKQLISSEKVSIKRLLDPKHEFIGASAEQYEDALKLTIKEWENKGSKHKKPVKPRNVNLRYCKGIGINSDKTKGLLLIYMLEIRDKGSDSPDFKMLIPAFGVSFPSSKSSVTVPYVINPIMQEELEFLGDGYQE